MIIWDILLLILGIGLLIKGADFFVDSGSAIGKVLKISELLLGMTVVAFGTSLPELIVGINASLNNNTGVVFGNVIGTNIFNIAVILAIICLIKPVKFLKETVKKDMYMSLVAGAVLLILMADSLFVPGSTNILSRADGFILLIFFGIFMYYSFYNIIIAKAEVKTNDSKEEVIKLKPKDIDKLVINILLMILGVVMVFFGADFSVDAAVKIAEKLNVSQTLVSIIGLAIGTSLPEIFTSITAMKKDKQGMAVGNLIGSSIFNIFFVLGITSTIAPISLPMPSLIVDAFVFVMISVVLIMFAKNRGKYEMSKLEGYSLLSIYVVYLTYAFIRK